MADRPNFLIIVTHEGQPGIKCVSAHATDGDAQGMVKMLASLVANGSAVYLVPMPQTSGILGQTIEPANEVVALPSMVEVPGMHIKPGAIITDNGDGIVTRLPAEQPAPFRRLSPDAFLIETQNMMESGEMKFRDADVPINEGGAFN